MPLTSLLWPHGKSPKSRRREARRKDGDRQSALSSVGHMNWPAWPRARTPTLEGRKTGRRMQTQMQKAMVGGGGVREPKGSCGGQAGVLSWKSGSSNQYGPNSGTE